MEADATMPPAETSEEKEATVDAPESVEAPPAGSARPRLRSVAAPTRTPPDPGRTGSPTVPSSGVVDLRTRVTGQPRRWNLWDLERRAREEAESDPVRYEEWSFLFVYLRQFATPDGSLPTEFDGLVRESFGDLLDHPG
jgi:hypothetical protein